MGKNHTNHDVVSVIEITVNGFLYTLFAIT